VLVGVGVGEIRCRWYDADDLKSHLDHLLADRLDGCADYVLASVCAGGTL